MPRCGHHQLVLLLQPFVSSLSCSANLTAAMKTLRGGGRPNHRYTLYHPGDEPGAPGKHVPLPHGMFRGKGFIKHRPKKYRTPRKHYRYKRAAQIIRERTSGPPVFKGKPPDDEYEGEWTGIKADRVRSKKLLSPDEIKFVKKQIKPEHYSFSRLPRIENPDGSVAENPYTTGTIVKKQKSDQISEDEASTDTEF